MYRFDNNNSKPNIYKYRYPSYLMGIAPPRVYSSVDVRNMLVPKTYELRKVSSVMNHSHRFNVMSTKSLEFKDVKSTKENVNEDKNTNSATDIYQKNNIKAERETDVTDNLNSVTDFQNIDDEVKLIKRCKKCHKDWPYDDFVWDQQVKTQMIRTIKELSPEC
jgi:hypothetical protein